MSITAPVHPDAKARAETIRQNAETRYEQIRSRGDLSDAAITANLARVYLDAQTKMDTLSTNSTNARAAQLRALTTTAFGIDDIAGTNPVDRAAASVSYRDAQDRAAAIDTPTAAAHLLTRADASGDELLARALAQHAYDHNWSEVLDNYLATRPKTATALTELVQLQNRPVAASHVFAFMLPRPAELATHAPYELSTLAASTMPAG